MKILIWGEVKSGGPYDVHQQLDYAKIYGDLEKNYHCNQMNVGNKVWIQGIISELSTEENELFFYNPLETWEEINNKYSILKITRLIRVYITKRISLLSVFLS